MERLNFADPGIAILRESHCCIIASDELLLFCEAFSDALTFGLLAVSDTGGTHIADRLVNHITAPTSHYHLLET